MYSKILIPLDGSNLAELSLDYATTIAVNSGAQLTLLHVCHPCECHCGPGDREFDAMHQFYVKYTAEKIEKTLRKSGIEKTEVEWVISTGDPASEVLRYARENKINLIVMSTHGRSGVNNNWAMGSVATKICQGSTIPVRLYRVPSSCELVPEEWPEKKILVLLDGSKYAEQVLPYVECHANLSDSEVTLLSICDYPLLFQKRSPSDTLLLGLEDQIEEILEFKTNERRAYLDDVEKKLKNSGINVKSVCLASHVVVSHILEYIEEYKPNLVTMTTHAQLLPSNWPIGNIPNKVIHLTTIPVLLVKPH
jgi:nucleotide-binding universal stress UspA family protein